MAYANIVKTEDGDMIDCPLLQPGPCKVAGVDSEWLAGIINRAFADGEAVGKPNAKLGGQKEVRPWQEPHGQYRVGPKLV